MKKKVETKKTKRVLKKVFMVGHSDDMFGEDVVTEVSLFGELRTESKQVLTFVGEKHFDTELEAVRHIEKMDGGGTWIIQEMFIWRLA